jgi:monoamine oxidase
MTPDTIDVAIVGAGAAGLAAWRALANKGLSLLLIEGRSRIGGRALTRSWGEGFVFDLGCEWLHSADCNRLAKLARYLGFGLIQSEPGWGERSVDINFRKSDQQAFMEALDSFEERLQLGARLPNDSVAAEWLEPGGCWNPVIDAVSTYVNGAELAKVSAQDTSNYRDTQVNWRVSLGYGELVRALGARAPVLLDATVTCIDHSGRDILVKTERCNISASRLICTLPTSVIADGPVHFSPPLPEKVEAAARLPLGHAEKVMFLLDHPDVLPVDGHAFGATNRTRTGSYDFRPAGQPCVQAFFGGTLARELAEYNAMTEYAIDELAGLVGSRIRRKLHPLGASSWAVDHFSRGSYSHAMLGSSGCRSKLAASVEDRLFFAGEATSTRLFSTAHGAYESGLRAAAEVIRSFSRNSSFDEGQEDRGSIKSIRST